jgi:hypothetical protein
MRCFSLLLGARNTGSSNGRFLRRDSARVQLITARHFPKGFTVLKSSGAWYDPQSKRFQIEDSRQIIICGATLVAIRNWALELAEALSQKELIVMESGIARPIRPRRHKTDRARGEMRRKASQRI